MHHSDESTFAPLVAVQDGAGGNEAVRAGREADGFDVHHGRHVRGEKLGMRQVLFAHNSHSSLRSSQVQINRNDIGEIKPSSFVGEMSFLELLDDETGVHRPKWLPSFVPNFSPTFSNFFGAYATATVTTSRTTRILTWKQSKLIKFMEENTQFANSFEAMLAADLVKKLKATAGRREGRRLVIPSGQRGLSRKRMKQAREGGAIRRRGIAKIWIRDALRRPLDGFHRFSRRGRGREAKPA